MKIKQMTNQHLINRIAFFERKLAAVPPEAHYMGSSTAAEDTVESDNRRNENIAEELVDHIKDMKLELSNRGGL